MLFPAGDGHVLPLIAQYLVLNAFLPFSVTFGDGYRPTTIHGGSGGINGRTEKLNSGAEYVGHVDDKEILLERSSQPMNRHRSMHLVACVHFGNESRDVKPLCASCAIFDLLGFLNIKIPIKFIAPMVTERLTPGPPICIRTGPGGGTQWCLYRGGDDGVEIEALRSHKEVQRQASAR
ncbi:hypothetical protein CPB84DRAFT_1827072 [Gymnopilus junonius]|uniref:Uncharacterized protein n=1 Tax=Gymnopilus junonius TaxID=109634 RepID=A0A9P5TKA0_GYMJU|nr:hypothetical protein CPB84DRAFT_1827072 [Gymnopilus junonius]